MYRWNRTGAPLLGVALISLASTTAAQNCVRPDGFGEPLGGYTATAAWEGNAGEACTLRAEFLAGSAADQVSAAFVTHPFPGGAQQVRLRFTLDYDNQIALNSVLQQAPVATITGTTYAPPSARLLYAFLNGSGGTPKLTLVHPDPASPPSGSQATTISLTGSTVHVGLDLQLGVNGYIRYWIDSDFSNPPTGRIPAAGHMDLSARGPAAGVVLGVFSASSRFRELYNGMDIVFRDIAVTDYLLRSDFE
ncbi:hypothetical protein [Tahibacter caeni]|uniref:hypothetical protein n=1 Tax=Tahibacter caeni TaxID=1453545 RepID=UPI0021476C4C|nr:hypothetical protein [Tahibacter caeni]